MTEKRFQYNVNKNSIEYNEKHFAYCNGEQNKIANKLNELTEENNDLKKENKKLKCINKQVEDRLENSGIGIALDMGEYE